MKFINSQQVNIHIERQTVSDTIGIVINEKSSTKNLFKVFLLEYIKGLKNVNKAYKSAILKMKSVK